MRFLPISIILAVLIISLFSSDAYGGLSVIRLKDGDSFTGEAELIKEDQLVTLTTKEGEQFCIPFDDIAPSSLYRLLAGEVADEDELGHQELVDFCIDNELYVMALREL
ncbi:hypothetical protein ACFL54_08185, partial [Planctomycetota bacterium]